MQVHRGLFKALIVPGADHVRTADHDGLRIGISLTLGYAIGGSLVPQRVGTGLVEGVVYMPFLTGTVIGNVGISSRPAGQQGIAHVHVEILHVQIGGDMHTNGGLFKALIVPGADHVGTVNGNRFGGITIALNAAGIRTGVQQIVGAGLHEGVGHMPLQAVFIGIDSSVRSHPGGKQRFAHVQAHRLGIERGRNMDSQRYLFKALIVPYAGYAGCRTGLFDHHFFRKRFGGGISNGFSSSFHFRLSSGLGGGFRFGLSSGLHGGFCFGLSSGLHGGFCFGLDFGLHSGLGGRHNFAVFSKVDKRQTAAVEIALGIGQRGYFIRAENGCTFELHITFQQSGVAGILLFGIENNPEPFLFGNKSIHNAFVNKYTQLFLLVGIRIQNGTGSKLYVAIGESCFGNNGGLSFGLNSGLDGGFHGRLNSGLDGGFHRRLNFGLDGGFHGRLDFGLSSGFHSGLNFGLDGGFHSGLNFGLGSGFHSGLNCRLGSGFHSRLNFGLGSGFHGGLSSRFDGGFRSGVRSGFGSRFGYQLRNRFNFCFFHNDHFFHNFRLDVHIAFSHGGYTCQHHYASQEQCHNASYHIQLLLCNLFDQSCKPTLGITTK